MSGAEGPSGRDRWWLLDLTLTQARQGHGCAIRSNPSAGSSKGVEWDSNVHWHLHPFTRTFLCSDRPATCLAGESFVIVVKQIYSILHTPTTLSRV